MFENIKPEDFFRETSAVQTIPVTDQDRSLGLDASEAGFDLFIRDHLAQCRQDAEEHDEFVPRAILANSDERRVFHGEADEVPQDFARRLNREAKQMNAHWMFMALVSPARVRRADQTDLPPIDADDIDAVRRAIRDGKLQIGVCWTAASVVDGPLSYRGGIIYLDDQGAPCDEVQGDMDSEIEDPFTKVLIPRR